MFIIRTLILGSLFLSSLALAAPKVKRVELVETSRPGMARVVRSEPIYSSREEVVNICTKQTIRNASGREGSVLGAVIGGAIGAQFDLVGAVIGTMAGSMAGEELGNRPREVETCNPETRSYSKIIGYDVQYVYEGRTYVQRLNYDPGVGSYLEVRVTVGR